MLEGIRVALADVLVDDQMVSDSLPAGAEGIATHEGGHGPVSSSCSGHCGARISGSRSLLVQLTLDRLNGKVLRIGWVGRLVFHLPVGRTGWADAKGGAGIFSPQRRHPGTRGLDPA